MDERNQNNDYKVISQGGSTVANSISERYAVVETATRNASGVIRPIYDGVKLLINEGGAIIRDRRSKVTQIYNTVQDSARGILGKFSPAPKYSVHSQTQEINRTDMSQEFVFRCGDYYMPLSLSYNLHAEKSDAVSQLVDGPEIVQMISKRPKTIELNIRLEKANRRDQTTRYMNIVSRDSNVLDTSRQIFSDTSTAFGATDRAPTQGDIPSATDLGAVLRELYEEKDVFEIENATINKSFGVNYVYIRSYDYTTTPGTSIVNISMVLREINMIENAIFISDTGINPDRAAGAPNVERQAIISVGQLDVDAEIAFEDLPDATEEDKNRLRAAAKRQKDEQNSLAVLSETTTYIEKIPDDEMKIQDAEIDLEVATSAGDIGNIVSDRIHNVEPPKPYISPLTGEYVDADGLVQDTLIYVERKKQNGEF